jgi:septum formation protein
MAEAATTRLVLASQSPRRIEMLKVLGLSFEAIPSDIDENVAIEEPAEFVEHLAKQKAVAVSSMLTPNDNQRLLVLGADTTVVLGREILNKPSSHEHAYQMLMRMSGRSHKVYTGVAVVDAGNNEVLIGHTASDVYFRSLDPAEVRAYARTEEPMDKAGAYALQGAASAFVDRIEGCYTNIIGLPVPLTVRMLRQVGVRVLGMP